MSADNEAFTGLFIEWLESSPSTGAWGTTGAEIVRGLLAALSRVEQERDRLLEAISPMTAGYKAGDRGAVLNEWMESGDWQRLWGLAAAAAVGREDGPDAS
jgi:hypothetical protein